MATLFPLIVIIFNKEKPWSQKKNLLPNSQEKKKSSLESSTLPPEFFIDFSPKIPYLFPPPSPKKQYVLSPKADWKRKTTTGKEKMRTIRGVTPTVSGKIDFKIYIISFLHIFLSIPQWKHKYTISAAGCLFGGLKRKMFILFIFPN